MVLILTHRGLEPSNPNFYPEGTIQAFENHLCRGFGIEFDINFVSDNIIIFHDPTLERITNYKDKRKIEKLSLLEIKSITKDIPLLEDILSLLKKYNPPISAMHLRGRHQNEKNLKYIIKKIEDSNINLSNLILFDLMPQSAKYLKHLNPQIITAASVAHPFDIKRYSTYVNNTLISIDEAIKFKEFYDWVWLDEWDTLDEDNNKKIFYRKENFEKLYKNNYKIALVTPELHRTSPYLYGGESHEHAKNLEILFERIKEILFLGPDAICTDYPEEVKSLISQQYSF